MKSPQELHEIFSASEYGKKLESQTRFSDFQPATISNDTWVGILGDDVNKLHHMPHTFRIAARFAIAQEMNPADMNTLLVTAMTHDWGKAIIGDIALPQKTKADEHLEEIAFRKIADTLLGAQGEQLSDTVWSVLNYENEQLGDAFSAIENIGYSTTALRAGYMGSLIVNGLVKVDLAQKDEVQLVSSLVGFERVLQAKSFPVLKGYVEKFPIIETLLSQGIPAVQKSTSNKL